MSEFKQSGNRYTMILVRHPQPDGTALFERVPFDLVRFNVDTDPDAEQLIMPVGDVQISPTGAQPDGPKLYERIWIVDTVPFRPGANGKIYFGNLPA